MYQEAAKVYMLRIVGYTIIMDKSHVHIDLKYMWLHSSLAHDS